jgi:hypothetical protein
MSLKSKNYKNPKIYHRAEVYNGMYSLDRNLEDLINF